MKTREFDIKNYNISEKIKLDLLEALKDVNIGNVNCSNSIGINSYNIEKDIEKYSKEYQKEIIQYFKEKYEIKKEETIQRYKKISSYAEKILFDDKDYLELIKVIEDNYYCQATTMLNDLIEQKTKGKTAKAMKYQARVMQINNNVTCD